MGGGKRGKQGYKRKRLIGAGKHQRHAIAESLTLNEPSCIYNTKR